MPRLLQFESKAAAEAFIAEHGLIAIPSDQLTRWVVVVLDSRGMFGVTSPNEMALILDW